MHPTLKSVRPRAKSRGQAVVEFALILPVLITMLLVAVDFGRVFLGWISLNNAARVGANFAALNPDDTWGPGSEFQTLMLDSMNAINCTPNPDPAAPPVFGPTKDPGELVRVDLSCDFTVLTPIIGAVVGNTVAISSSSAFPISFGCLVDCAVGPPQPPPPPPPSNCRAVPDAVGLSVAGARASWIAAGFLGSSFIPSTGSDTLTVGAVSVTEQTDEGCTGSERSFNSTMTVTVEDLVPQVCPTGIHVPNLLGVTVAAARTSWTDAGFSGAFLPTGNDARIVILQVTDPASAPGDCLAPDTTVTVAHGPPPPPPPPQPCTVPSFVNTLSDAATTTWTSSGFIANNLSLSRGGSFTIQSQTLVGGTFIACNASIEVSHKAGGN